MEDNYGTLIIRSNPSDAMVIIEGTSKITPAIFDLKNRKLPYNVTIKKVGYDKYTNSVVISKGSKIEINAVLEN